MAAEAARAAAAAEGGAAALAAGGGAGGPEDGAAGAAAGGLAALGVGVEVRVRAWPMEWGLAAEPALMQSRSCDAWRAGDGGRHDRHHP